jgi:hypothetical protein
MEFSVVFAKDCDVNQFAESCLKWTFGLGILSSVLFVLILWKKAQFL